MNYFCNRMEHKDYFYFGKVLRPKGYHGEIKLALDVDDPINYGSLDALLIERKRELIPFIIKFIQLEGNKATVKLEGIDDEMSAEALAGCAVFLPVQLLPKLEGNKFYFHEVEGFEILDLATGTKGTLNRVIDLPTNPLFEVDVEGKEVLIPINDEIIRKVDRDNRRIEIEAPEGLIEIYL